MHTMRRPIYIVLHGETTESRLHVCGGDPPLNERGKEFARNLASWFKVKHPDGMYPLYTMSFMDRFYACMVFTFNSYGSDV